jgi:hypothetical protein
MIGVKMSVDDVQDAHAGLLRGIQIGLDGAYGVDDGGRCLAATSDKIGGRDRIAMKVLAQDHGRFLDKMRNSGHSINLLNVIM